MRGAVALFLVVIAGCRIERATPPSVDSLVADSVPVVSSIGSTGFLLGLRTAGYSARNLDSAKAWYREVIGVGPHVDEPFYVGFNVGGFELGIVPEESAGARRAGAGVAYWGVSNAEVAWQRLLELGATPHEPIADVGGGVRIGSLHDPFGNVLGIVENPGFRIEQ
jgi:predicted enzyme related to lactoylglutathione lyase